MRTRTLSNEAVLLYLNATAPARPKKWYQVLIHNLFHSDYDDRVEDVVHTSRNSTKALCAEFDNPKLSSYLRTAVWQTIQLISEGSTVRQRTKDFKFFAEVMQTAFKESDHQTAHMLHCALTHPSLNDIVVPKRVARWFANIGSHYGAPVYEKHVHFWRTVRSDQILPSVIAFNTFKRRRQFVGRTSEVEEANEHMELFKYLEHDPQDLLPVYTRCQGFIAHITRKRSRR